MAQQYQLCRLHYAFGRHFYPKRQTKYAKSGRRHGKQSTMRGNLDFICGNSYDKIHFLSLNFYFFPSSENGVGTAVTYNKMSMKVLAAWSFLGTWIKLPRAMFHRCETHSHTTFSSCLNVALKHNLTS